MHLVPRRPERIPSARSLLVALVAVVLTTTMLPASPAAAVKVKVDRRLFGVHDSNLSGDSWPAVRVGAVRLWDGGVSWRDIETSPGVYDFTKLDEIVRQANARNVEVTLVLGQTPDFYATSSSAATSMPNDLGAWERYVRALVTRYAPPNWGGVRGIGAYQVWNEVNVVNYWTGSPEQMRTLTRSAYGVIKSVDPGALVVGPSMGTRLSGQVRWIGGFYYPQAGKPAIWKSMDAIGLHLYPTDSKTPEHVMTTYNQVRKALAVRGVPAGKPVWNTEINYGAKTGSGLTHGGSATPISAQKQAAFVIRTFMLQAARGIKRVHWYAWDMRNLGSGGPIANTLLTDPNDGTTVTLAGKAFALVQGWMVGGTLVGATRSALPCAKDRLGTYTCVIKYSGGFKRVYWNPNKRVRITTVKSATQLVRGDGTTSRIRGGSKQYVGFLPVMVRSRA